ncbi:MAG: hypothetical protein IPL39_18895 [Opitutaceae bacterium]|nr:hypothetical protein [Opitutaceae bacterium]
MLLETAAEHLQSNLNGAAADLEGEDLLRAAEEELGVEGLRATGRDYLARAAMAEADGHGDRPHVSGLRETGDDYLADAEQLAEFHGEAVGLYRALLTQAPQLVA